MAKEKPKFDENTVVVLPLAKVKADFKWNSRPESETSVSEIENEQEGTSLTALMDSIREKGQREPVLVRAKGSGFELVYGFRRYAAIRDIAKKDGVKDPTIRCFVADNMSDTEAREENLRENLARKQLKPSMLCKGLEELLEAYGDKYNVTEMADRIGINRPYASMLINTIIKKLKPDLRQKWYDQAAETGVNRVASVANLPEEKQEAAFTEKVATGGRGNKADGGRAALESKAMELGAYLGKLQGLDLITTDGLDFNNADHLRAIGLKLKSDTPKDDIKFLAEAASTAFEEAVKVAKNPPPPEEKKVKGKKADKAEAEAAN